MHALGIRIAAGLVLATLGVVVLVQIVRDDPPSARPSRAPRPVAETEPSVSVQERIRPLLAGLRGHARHVHLAVDAAALPHATVPVFAVALGGALRVVRAADVPTDPTSRGSRAVGIVLPRPLEHLDADERATLLAVVGAATARSPAAEGPEFVVHGFPVTRFDRERLLRWLRS